MKPLKIKTFIRTAVANTRQIRGIFSLQNIFFTYLLFRFRIQRRCPFAFPIISHYLSVFN